MTDALAIAGVLMSALTILLGTGLIVSCLCSLIRKPFASRPLILCLLFLLIALNFVAGMAASLFARKLMYAPLPALRVAQTYRAQLAAYAELAALAYEHQPLPLSATGLSATSVRHLSEERTGTAGLLLADDHRVVIAFRGTELSDPRDWIADAAIHRVPWRGGGLVHAGFRRAWDLISPQVNDALDSVAFRFRWDRPETTRRISVVGHSLGGAIATLAADSLRLDGYLARTVTFGCPRVGDPSFAAAWTERHRGLNERIVNGNDVVPRVPLPWRYRQHGRLLYLTRHGELLLQPRWWQIAVDRVLGYRLDLLRDHQIDRYRTALQNPIQEL